MVQNYLKLQSMLLREYYKDFSKYSKGTVLDRKVAWITAFTPVELLEALEIDYYYPESYAAVIAASEMEQECIACSQKEMLSTDCCSYSCCFNGSLSLEKGPRGIMPQPDVLIATNNQCNTLPGWWNTLAEKYHIPLIVLDYPGETSEREISFKYVTDQHKELVKKLEEITGNKLNEHFVETLISNSIASVAAWKKVSGRLHTKKMKPISFFDNINFLITARCKPETSEMYELLDKAIAEKETDLDGSEIRIFWLGYPLWYHKDRYFSEVTEGLQIVGSNYITWWNLDYSGNTIWEKLFSAYNYTFLNLNQESRNKRLNEVIQESEAKGAIVIHNKSCKCDFVSARNVDILQVELDIDMIDRNYLNYDKAKKTIEILKEALIRNNDENRN